MAEETVVFARKASGLVREMNWFDVLLITIAGPAASGMTYYAVKQPGVYPGGNMVLAFFLGGLMWVLPVILMAIYASSFPRSGAMYVVISRVTHPLLGFLPNWLWVWSSGLCAGFLNYIGLNLISAALLISGEITGSDSMRSAGEWLAGNWTRWWLAMVLTAILWFFELLGMDRLKWFVRICIYVPLVVTICAIVIMFVGDGQGGWDAVYGSGSYDAVIAAANEFGIEDALLSQGEAISSMFVAVFWAYSALESMSFMGSEVKTPRTSFLRGMGIGISTVILLYCINAWSPGFSYGSEFIRDYSWLYNNEDAKAVAALQVAMGDATPPAPSIPFYAGIVVHQAWFAILLGIGYFFWYLNTSLVIWMASVRGLFAMAFDRQLPLSWCAVSKRGVPTNATHIVGIGAIAGTFLGLGDAAGTGSAGVALAILDFTALFFIWAVGLAAIFLPYTRPDLFEKTTFQFKWGNMPVVSLLGALVLGIGWWTVFMVGLELTTEYSWISMSALIVLGYVIVAWMYAKNRKEGIDPNQIYTAIPPA